MLKRHKFGEESFLIKSNFTPEFKDYYDYFKYIGETSNVGLNFTSPEESELHVEAQSKLEELLLGDEDNSSMRELYRIADYRNYKEYDIHKILNDDHEHSFSLNKSATDSGGQAETSYYIIRSIAAFSSFDKDINDVHAKGIGFLLIDEGFKRIDDRRPGKILNYLLNDLGFQLITAMPPQNEGVFTDFVTGRYEIFKEVVDPSYDNFKVTTHAQYSVQNKKAISKLLEADKKKIQQELSFE